MEDILRTDTGIRAQTPTEELVNSITHGIGAALSAAGLAVLVVLASRTGDPWKIVGFSVYGSTLVLLYTMSTLYHAVRPAGAKRVFKYLDHASIYLLIAGTYTPVTLTVLRGPWGWSLFGVIWAMAAAGIVVKIFMIGKKRLSVLLYVLMGWMVVVAVRPLLTLLSPVSLAWMVAGGVFYTLGTVFYGMRRLPFNHAVWHLFVLMGSLAHYFFMLSLVLGA